MVRRWSWQLIYFIPGIQLCLEIFYRAIISLSSFSFSVLHKHFGMCLDAWGFPVGTASTP